MYLRLPAKKYWDTLKEIRKTSGEVRKKEQIRSGQKVELLRRRDRNCLQHVVFRWVLAFQRQKCEKES